MEFARRVDHTLLDKDAAVSAYDELIETADELRMNVCLPPSRLDRVPEGFGGEVVAVVAFPHGTTTPETKAKEARLCVKRGATEVDTACNVSFLKSDEDEAFVRDVRAVAEEVPVTKAIIETGLLSDEEKRRAAHLCVEAGADYVKTCTGYAPDEATVEDVRLLEDTVGDDAQIKASGGIRDAESAIRLLEAGASRIGASAGDEIVRGAHDLSPPKE